MDNEDGVLVDREMLEWLVDCAKLLGRRFRTGDEYEERIRRADRLLGATPTGSEEAA